MLSGDDAWFEQWRGRELRRLDDAGVAYLDYTGTAPFPESLARADAARLLSNVHGNPHSRSAPSLRATGEIEAARAAILEFLNADPAEYTVVLTPNASGACRLVGESFPFAPGGALALTADNHNSVNGIREHAARKGASIRVLPLDEELRLAVEGPGCAPSAPSLFAFPAQSNFSGVRHPLALVERARDAGWRVLLDAAAFLPSQDLDLRAVQPDFLCLSLYKIAGYPGGLGALVARHEALSELRRPWFAGGTVRWVSVEHGRHLLSVGAEGFEDGTPNFLAAGAVPLALGAVRAAGRERLVRHLGSLTSKMLAGLREAEHRNGSPRVRIHGPDTTLARGATVAFSLLDDEGEVIPYWEVEEFAREAGLAIRGGCFCNPGCAERAFDLADASRVACLDSLGEAFTIPAFAACTGDSAVGALRASLGLGSVQRDVDRLLAFIEPGVNTEGTGFEPVSPYGRRFSRPVQ